MLAKVRIIFHFHELCYGFLVIERKNENLDIFYEKLYNSK
jgi:hypothetical protein